MLRHARWIIALFIVVAISWMLMDRSRAFNESLTEETASAADALLILVLIPALLVAIIIFFIQVGKALRSTHRYRRKQERRISKASLRQGGPATDEPARRAAWQRAGILYSQLRSGHRPEPLSNFTVATAPGEFIVMEIRAHYSRYYGQDVTYTQGSAVAFGHPAFVLGALLGSASRNRKVRRQAAAMAAAQWREGQFCPVIVTDRRLFAQANGQWLTFDFAGITAIYPEMEQWTLVLQFEVGEPLRLSGPDVASVSVWILYQLWGNDALDGHPALARLRPESAS